jgi:hypothetical protein
MAHANTTAELQASAGAIYIRCTPYELQHSAVKAYGFGANCSRRTDEFLGFSADDSACHFRAMR